MLFAIVTIIILAAFVAVGVFIVPGGAVGVKAIVAVLQMLLAPFDTLVEFCSSRRCSYSDIRNITHTPHLLCTT